MQNTKAVRAARQKPLPLCLLASCSATDGRVRAQLWASLSACALLPCCMLHVACLPELEIEVVQDVAIARCQDTIRRSRLHTSRHCARTHSPGARGSSGRSWRARHGGTWWFSSTLVSLYVIASALIVRTCDRRDLWLLLSAPQRPLHCERMRARACQGCVSACVCAGQCVCVCECVRA